MVLTELIGGVLAEVELTFIGHSAQGYSDDWIVVPERQGQVPLTQVIKNKALLALLHVKNEDLFC